MTDTSTREDGDRGHGTPGVSEVDSAGGGPVRPRRRTPLPDGGEAPESTEDDDSLYGEYTYNFAWYFPRVDGWRSILIASALVLTGFLVVPLLVVLGYSYRVGRAAALGRASPPPFEDWQDLLVDGLRFSVLVVPAAVLFVIPLLGPYVALAVIAAYMGSGSLTDALFDGSALRLMVSVFYVTAFIEYGVYVTAIVILSFLIVGVGWVLGPGFLVVSSGAFMGYIFNRAAERDLVEPARS